jgi:dethiobiotin synthetase
MQPFFITATGTDIGKTFLTSALCWQLRQRGKTARALKPVISGVETWSDPASDTAHLLAAQGLELTEANFHACSPWRFRAPLSPSMAAPKEGGALTVSQIAGFCLEEAEKEKNTDYFFVEGVGGVMVPLNSHHTVLDWMEALDYPVILVTGSYLGTLSHTLTALLALEARKLRLDAVVVSETPGSTVDFAETCQHLRDYVPAGIRLHGISRVPSAEYANHHYVWQGVEDMTWILE